MTNDRSADHVRPDLTCPWWAIVIPALAFAVLAIIARGTNTLKLDLRTSVRIQSFDGSFASWLADLGDALGDYPVALSLLAVAWVGLAVLGQRRDLWFVLIVAIGRLLAVPLKGWLNSPRPTLDQINLVGTFDGYGFPSGHTLTSTLAMGTLAYLIARRFPHNAVRTLLLGLWVLGAAITAYARIWHGAHWLTDTLGGASLGVMITMVAANVSASITMARSSVTPTPPRQMPTQ